MKEVVMFLLFGLAFAGIVPGVQADGLYAGAVYTMSNESPDNRVVARYRDASGLLIEAGQFSADGAGTGASLGNEQGIVFSDDGASLVTFNAGANEVVSFRIFGD